MVDISIPSDDNRFHYCFFKDSLHSELYLFASDYMA